MSFYAIFYTMGSRNDVGFIEDRNMDSIQKFCSDIDKIMKHDRADNGGNYNGERACRKIGDFFSANNRGVGELGASFADYWMQTYIMTSADISNEPTADNINKLAAMQALLCAGEDGPAPDDVSCLTTDDWKELCSLVNYEAEDIPLDLLNTLMTVFVDKKALD